MAEPAVIFDNVSRIFGDVTALDGVSLTVPEGSIFGVVGTSGAGKSTLLRTVNGLEKPTGGTVTTLGVEPASLGTADLRGCLLYTSPSPRDKRQSRMPSSA